MELDEIETKEMLILAAKCIIRLQDGDRYGRVVRDLNLAADMICEIAKSGRASGDAILFLNNRLGDTAL